MPRAAAASAIESAADCATGDARAVTPRSRHERRAVSAGQRRALRRRLLERHRATDVADRVAGGAVIRVERRQLRLHRGAELVGRRRGRRAQLAASAARACSAAPSCRSPAPPRRAPAWPRTPGRRRGDRSLPARRAPRRRVRPSGCGCAGSRARTFQPVCSDAARAIAGACSWQTAIAPSGPPFAISSCSTASSLGGTAVETPRASATQASSAAGRGGRAAHQRKCQPDAVAAVRAFIPIPPSRVCISASPPSRPRCRPWR